MPKSIAGSDLIKIDFVSGKGCFLYDAQGKEYLDFLGGWCTATTGWQDPEMVKAMTAQAKEAFYFSPYFASSKQEYLADLLIEHAPGKLARAYRCTSGSEAVEFALRCARASSGKPFIVSIDDVYHGHTYGAAAVGNDCVKAMEPCPAGYIKLRMPRSVEEGREVAAEFEALVKERGDIGAFLSEPIWTNVGLIIPPEGFYEAIQETCRKYDVLLVMDEVATGMGRCGKFFASDFWGLEPDIICLGKSFTGGYATMGATLVTEKVFKGSRSISDYSTFGWMPNDLAAATRNVELLISRKLPENAAEVGAYLLQELKPLEKLLKVKEVRGAGMAFAIELRLPIAPLIALQCFRKGLTMAMANANTMFFSPPLCLTKEEARKGAEILASVLGGHLEEQAAAD